MGALIETRYRYRDGIRREFFDVTDTASAARTIVRLATGKGVHVGVAPRVRRAGGKKRSSTSGRSGQTSMTQTRDRRSTTCRSRPRS